MKNPLCVIVTWDDAVSDTRSSVEWEWSVEAIRKIGEDEQSSLVYDRTTRGLLGYIDEEKCKLFKDYDADGYLGNSTTIPTGWISKITTMSGKVLFTKAGARPKRKTVKHDVGG